MRGERMLMRGRKRARERMDAECAITRTVMGEIDEETGLRSNIDSPVYSGICRLKGSAAATNMKEVDAGSQLLVTTSPELHLPADTAGVQPGDQVRITKCQSRPALVGRAYKIKAQVEGGQVTALRYRVEAADER